MRALPSLALWVPALVVGAAAAAYLVLALSSRRMPELQVWHRERPPAEFRAGDLQSTRGLADYLAREQRVFAWLEQAIAVENTGEFPLGRYQPGGRNNPATFPVNWNRTFEIRPDEIRAGALLLHGLTDSPYSLRTVGEILASRGFYVLGLRLPGHGTVPASLAAANRADWRAAVRVGAAHTVGQLAPGQPFWVVGYSNGAALALDHAVAAIEETALGRVDRLVLLSPALGVTRLAAFGRWHRPLSVLPFFEKFQWHTIYPEHDPFKYNSFPNSAGYQTHRLIHEVRARLEGLRRRQRTGDLPALLAFQSVADATVRSDAVVEDLLAGLLRSDSELVLFDINRVSFMKAYFATDPSERLRRLLAAPSPPFRLTAITNVDHDSLQVMARTWEPGSPDAADEVLPLEWPMGVFSLSHVSVPFPPDDPIYGAGRADAAGWGVTLGSLEPRGERDLLVVPVDLFTRLRHNPFFPYLERRIRELPLEGVDS